MTVRVIVTEDCAGTGQCVAVAPGIFGLDDDGLSRVSAQPVAAEEIEAAQRAARLCPMAAIRIEE